MGETALARDSGEVALLATAPAGVWVTPPSGGLAVVAVALPSSAAESET